MSRIEDALNRALKKQQGIEHQQDNSNATDTRKRGSIVNRTVINICKDNPYLLTINNPDSPIAEEYRKLKSMVVKLTKSSDFKNTIMITSALGAEGKSITSLNLAITLAQEYDHTVLLVDADLRQPSFYRYLSIEPGYGLSDCLMNGMDVGEAIIKTDIGKLSLLPAGKMLSNPVELLLSDKMKELVKEVKHRYSDRYVIFDTPPVLPFAETHSLAGLMDAVILVVMERRSSVKHVNEALNMLKGANILGILYNNVHISPIDSYYHNYYYYYYRQRNNQE